MSIEGQSKSVVSPTTNQKSNMVVVMQPTWKFQIVGSRIVRPYMVYMWENPTCYCCMGVYFSMVYHRRVKPSQIVCHDCHPFLKKAWSIENKTNPNLKLLTVQKKATCEVCPLIDYFIGLSFSRCRDCRAWIREKKKTKTSLHIPRTDS